MYPDFKKVTTYTDGPVQTSTGAQPTKQLRPCFVNNTQFCYCRGTACEHNPINMENETEVLRIEGNVTVPKGEDVYFKSYLLQVFSAHNYQWSGSIVPQDSPTGMRLYRVEEVEYKNKQISMLQNVVDSLQETSKANDKAFLSLSEELAQERESKEFDRQLDLAIIQGQKEVIIDQYNKIKALKKRLENKNQTRWRTFTKWFRGLFKKKGIKLKIDRTPFKVYND